MQPRQTRRVTLRGASQRLQGEAPPAATAMRRRNWELNEVHCVSGSGAGGYCIGGGSMKDVDRRSALAFGFAATSAVVMAESAKAQPYAPDQGKEIDPGVRRVDLGKRASMIPAYKTVSMRDVVYQPKSKSMNPAMDNDMVCHCLEGDLRVNQGPGKDSTVKKAD